MSHTEPYTIARCPSCAVKLKFRPSRPPRACPRCKRPISVPPPVPLGAAAGPPPLVAGLPRPPQAAKKSLGFGGYLAAHWRASRWHWIVPLLLGLVAAAVASLVKPLLGIRGLVAGAATVLGVALICGVTYFMGRVIDYAIRERRDPKASRPSWFGRLAHLGLLMLFPLGAFVAAEAFGPPQGWLATWVPSVAAIVPGGRAKQPPPEPPRDGDGGGGTGVAPQPSGEPKAADPLLDPANPFKVIEE